MNNNRSPTEDRVCIEDLPNQYNTPKEYMCPLQYHVRSKASILL